MLSKVEIFNLLFVIVFTLTTGCNNNTIEIGDTVILVFKIYNKNNIILDESFFHTDFNKIDCDELLSFVVGKNEVIKGWDSLIVGCKKNIIYTFNIPSNQAYGNEAIYHDIPANSDLILTFKIVDIIKHEKK